MQEKARKFVHHLRSKTEEEKKQILYIFMICVIVIMFIFWIWSLGGQISDPQNKSKMKQDLAPFSTLKDDLLNGYDDISGTSSPVIQ